MPPSHHLCSSTDRISRRPTPRWPHAAVALLLLPSCAYTRPPETPIPCSPFAFLDPREAPCPDGMAAVAGGSLLVRDGRRRKGEIPFVFAPFCIDRAEVTVDRYLACVHAGDCGREHLDAASPDGVTFLPETSCNAQRGDRHDHPINCVDFAQAERFCMAHGYRLPSEEEWEGVAQGDTCPSDSDGPERWSWLRAKGPRTFCIMNDQRVDGTCPIGANPTGDSPPGIHDLIGNVWEWTVTRWGASPKRVVRGGSWMSVEATPWRRSGYPPAARQSDLGFRCAADLPARAPAP